MCLGTTIQNKVGLFCALIASPRGFPRNTKTTKTVLDRVSTEGKTILASNTNKAFTDGAFGLPWMVCTDATGQKEGFWGVDHLGQVAQFLELKKPINRGWRAVL